MLEVQIARRSRQGVVVPIARSDDPKLVALVAQHILAEMRSWDFDDELLSDIAQREQRDLREALAAEGLAAPEGDHETEVARVGGGITWRTFKPRRLV